MTDTTERRGMSRAVAVILAALGLVLAAGAVTAPARADTTICEKYGSTSIQNGKYIVQNNNWGDDTTQCINVTGTGFTVTQASHNKPTNGAPGSYPSIYAGCHYANCTSGSGLPMRVSDSRFNGVQTSVSMSYPGGGVYDAAYDIWFDPTPRTDGQNTGAEIMVWLNRVGSIQPVGSRVGMVNLAGATWEVWYGNIGWNVISYVRTSATNSISFAVRTFADDAINRGYAQRSWYLTSVQAGFEPWVGQNGLAVNDFSYSVGGSDPGNGDPGNGGGRTCSAAGSTANQWNNGYVIDPVTVTNTGSSTTNGWTVTFTLPAGHTLSGSWNAGVTVNGQTVTARNVSHNGSLAPGAKASFGFQVTRPGGNLQVPSGYTCTAS
ncbi:cellulose binding domain-containing protein [Streptosporangium sp. NPDC048047]|uniref:GH12 family glycosyl hydrolase domain-containing protein n=1 Tax=Streptosporangium sp. NPDC048047 TaxID=3155748 RepID=UPI0034295354